MTNNVLGTCKPPITSQHRVATGPHPLCPHTSTFRDTEVPIHPLPMQVLTGPVLGEFQSDAYSSMCTPHPLWNPPSSRVWRLETHNCGSQQDSPQDTSPCVGCVSPALGPLPGTRGQPLSQALGYTQEHIPPASAGPGKGEPHLPALLPHANQGTLKSADRARERPPADRPQATFISAAQTPALPSLPRVPLY